MHIGGNETTQYALTAEAQLLAQHPEVVAELRADPAKIRFFVEEAMRLYSPTQGLSGRTVARDTEIHGVKIPKGSLLHLRYAAANRDPDLVEETGRARPPAVDRTEGRHTQRCPQGGDAGVGPPPIRANGGGRAPAQRCGRAGAVAAPSCLFV